MAKKYSKISNNEKERLFKDFCGAISVLKTPEEVRDFVIDLLTKAEVIMIAKRIKIAKLLIDGKSYQSIENLTGAGQGTIARINYWLSEGGEGFRLIAKRTKREELPPEPSWAKPQSEWNRLKRRYPAMFWPQLAIEGVIKTMDEKQKDKVRRAIQKLDRKSSTYRQISKILRG